MKHYDLIIIGGGINGCAIAADAAGRGLSVYLCDKGDLSSGTSSYSSKLIHGGLRYLEHYEFALVREALREQEILMRKAPHVIKPMRFIMPYHHRLRPTWLLRLGLFLYDKLYKRNRLRSTRVINLKHDLRGRIFKSSFSKGFVYSDCYADDSRLVILNALMAHEQGADINPRCEVLQCERHAEYWHVNIMNKITGIEATITGKCLVNAAGPWVNQVHRLLNHAPVADKVALVKGSHIVVKKLYEGEHAFLLQLADGRVIFIIPFADGTHLIGTTDVPYESNLDNIKPTEAEISYLCNGVNEYLNVPIKPEDVIWSFAGVRALQNNTEVQAQKISRDYTIELDNAGASLLTVIGGKITTHRRLAEVSLAKLTDYFPNMLPAWTEDVPLPGGGIEDMQAWVAEISQEFSWLPRDLLRRYTRKYGQRCLHILQGRQSIADLGCHFGHGLYEAEVCYLRDYEWAHTAEDILWRRSKLGLYFKPHEVRKLELFLKPTTVG